MEFMTIGKLAGICSVGVETIRYYERLGLIAPVERSESGYRRYNQESVKRLRFIRHAKELGFTLKEIRELLELRRDPETGCSDLKKRASEKKEQIEKKIKDLMRIKDVLDRLIQECSGEGPLQNCPILEALED